MEQFKIVLQELKDTENEFLSNINQVLKEGSTTTTGRK